MIRWEKYFDAVYVLSLADFRERRRDMTEELRRVGIVDSTMLHWKVTVRNGFYKYIWENPGFPIEDWWKHLEGCMNCTMGHYEIMKECTAMGYERVLVIEDDVRFLRDLGEVETLLENMPEYDICLFDKNIPWEKDDFFRAVKDSLVNDYYIDFEKVRLNSTGCYAVSAKAMREITAAQERFFRPADEALNGGNPPPSPPQGRGARAAAGDGLRRVASIKNMAIQDMARYKAELTETDRVIYDGIVRMEDYNLRSLGV